MNKFSNLSKLFDEIELLESAGLYKAANILHKKFVKEAQPVIDPFTPQFGNRQPKIGPMGLAQTPRTNIAPMSDPTLDQTDQDNNQIVDEDYLFTVIKSLADKFEDFIQDAILGRDTNKSLGLAKNFIDRVEQYVGPKYSQRLKDYANAQLDIMRKRYADMYQKYYVKDNVDQSSTNPSSQEEKEKRLYMNALNDIILAFKEPNKEAGEAIFQKTVNQFQNPKRKLLFINQIDRQRRKYFPQGPFLPEMSNEEGQQLTNSVNQNVAKQKITQPNATKPNVSTSTDTNNQLYQIVSNFYRSRDVTVTSPEQMYADLKADPARKNVVRNHIRTSKNPNTNQLVALFDSKTK
jgi:hypothetical protein